MSGKVTRRKLLKSAATGAAALAATGALKSGRVRAQTRTLRILQWSHFVPAFDRWFDPFARQWGRENNVDVVVDHIGLADLIPRANAEVAAQAGHDLYQFLAPPGAFEPEVVDLADLVREVEGRHGPMVPLARASSFNRNTNKWFAFSDNWVPDPGDYLRSVWTAIGMPDGPKTWNDLLVASPLIKRRFPEIQIPIGIGLSQEIDTNMATRALMWSYDASVQDAMENVTINSPQTIEAVEFMSRLFREGMSPAVLAWNAASNNQTLIARQTAYILNSISAYRTAQDNQLPVADDIFFSEPLRGPRGTRWVGNHVMGCYVIWRFSRSQDLAKQFLIALVDNYREAVLASKLYNFPSFYGSVAERGVPLAQRPAGGQRWVQQVTANDPFDSRPPDKLAILNNALEWSTNIGHPGPANPAASEIFDTFVVTDMFARAATGQLTPRAAVEEAERRVKAIFAKWRQRGLVGGSR